MATISTTEYQDRYMELRVYLIRRRLSQRQIALALGKSTTWINDVLMGKKSSPALIERIATEFNIPRHLLTVKSEGETFHGVEAA